jgi:Arc/MetJ-type ribon-helix-helix transcriptional regulator
MRTIINISIPKETAQEAKRTVREEGFASMSEYFRYLLREEKRRKLFAELEKQRKSGRWIKAKSMRDLR